MKMIINSKTIKKYKEEVLNPNKKDLEKEKLPRNVWVVNGFSLVFFISKLVLFEVYSDLCSLIDGLKAGNFFGIVFQV